MSSDRPAPLIRVWGLGFTVSGLGFRVYGSGLRAQGSGLRAQVAVAGGLGAGACLRTMDPRFPRTLPAPLLQVNGVLYIMVLFE